MQISATIVTYKNSHEMLNKAISSFLNTEMDVKLYIVDNSPTDEIKTLCNDSRIEYIFNNANVGFGAGHNVIMRQPEKMGEYHIVLNPDIYYEEGVIEGLYEYMEKNSDVGNVMPKVLYPDNKIQFLCKLLPTPTDWIGRFFVPSKKWKERRNYNFEMKFTDYNSEMSVPYLSGCFMFLRKSVIQELGVFDEGIFMYGEDTDLSRRIYVKYRNIFYPNVIVFHEFAKGSHKSFRLFWIHVKAAVYYFNKWGWFVDKERKSINDKVKRTYCK